MKRVNTDWCVEKLFYLNKKIENLEKRLIVLEKKK